MIQLTYHNKNHLEHLNTLSYVLIQLAYHNEDHLEHLNILSLVMIQGGGVLAVLVTTVIIMNTFNAFLMEMLCCYLP